MTHSVRQVLYRYMDAQPQRTISGLHLQRSINRRTGKATFASTILGYLRDYADESGADLELLDRQKSLYKFTPGHKIAEAIRGGKE